MPEKVISKTKSSSVKAMPKYLQRLTDLSKYGVTYLRGFYKGKPCYHRYRHDIQDLYNQCNYDDCDYFYTPNLITKAYDKQKGCKDYRADQDHVCALRMIWIDIDLKHWIPNIIQRAAFNDPKSELYIVHDACQVVREIIKQAGLPDPTSIDYSGFGIHVSYIFNHIVPIKKNRKNIVGMYKRTMVNMDKLFNYVSVDMTGHKLADSNNDANLAKLFRMPNTSNNKYLSRKTYTYQSHCFNLYDSNNTYSLDYLYNTYTRKEPLKVYLQYRKKYLARGRKWRALEHKHYRENGKRWVKENAENRKRGRSIRSQYHHNPSSWKSRYSLYKATLSDLQSLVDQRHGDMSYKSPDGELHQCNEFVVFYYGINYVHLSNDRHGAIYNLAGTLQAFNNELKNPLDKYDVHKIITEANNNPQFMSYGCPGKAYYIKHSKYIKNLGISRHEQRSLKTLISPTEKAHRRKEAYPKKIAKARAKRHSMSILTGAKHRRLLRIKKVQRMSKQGMTGRTIANLTKLNRRTVSKYLKANINVNDN